ncbi:MAG: tRNA (N(6)-L-threonylcarbamoyladenosine(37)-C(2))-methylthiotransferase MtaB [Ruminococcus sp.]|nr:tRNA (N(6)-L-threonylcarbamoyladenosine(37)-C(2))-methylthiotransferase MtaB [Ruminococcus sp.]
MNVFYYTFGCKVNQYETENIKLKLESNGFYTVSTIASADIAVVNTCTVTSRSDLKCRQLLHKIKKDNPQCIVVLTGCFPQAFSDDAESMTECDIITGSSNKSQIPDYIDEYLINRQRIIDIPPHQKGEKFEQMSNSNVAAKTRAYMKIQDGCDQYCSYCIIPYARGHVRSKPIDVIAQETCQLTKAGHKEIVVVGINLWCYGKDFNDDIRLVDAVETICKNAQDCRVRLGSIEPEMVTDEDIIRLSHLDNFCPQFHLSLQSGCDRTLKAMNRKYTSAEYEDLCTRLRASFPDCAITTDVMVGFVGETDQDFNESLEFVKKIGFSKVHIFPYSIRSGTRAEKMQGHLPKHIKQNRASKMEAVCKSESKKFLESMIGKTQKVLFEKEKSAEYHQGYTPNYTLVKVSRKSADVSLRRQMRVVLIIGIEKDYCIGKIIDTQEDLI